MADLLPLPKQTTDENVPSPGIADRWDGVKAATQKLLRYRRLYGVGRTWAKVRAKRHLRRRFDTLPPASKPVDAKQTVVLLGCGNYAHCTLAYYLRRAFGDVLSGAMDIDADRAASLAGDHAAPFHTTDANELLSLDGQRLAVIASNHASHAGYAIAAMRRGLDVYIEKPHVTTHDQLRNLLDTFDQTGRRLYLGFNRPGSRLGRTAIRHLHDDDGPMMLSWFIAGHEIAADHWYMNPGEGGRVLGNLCHWSDFCLRAVGPEAFPITITPCRGSQPDINCTVTLQFADGSMASLVFSEKASPLDGVRETLVAQRGRTLLRVEDFDRLVVDRGASHQTIRPWRRDHGHRANIERAYCTTHQHLPYDRAEAKRHARQTALLFLAIRDSLRDDRIVTVADRLPAAIAGQTSMRRAA